MQNDDLSYLEESILSMRDDFIEKHNRNVDQAQEQFGKRNISAKKITVKRNQEERATPRKPKNSAPQYNDTQGYVIQLIVRNNPIGPEYVFTHVSDKLSRLEAEIDAKKAALSEWKYQPRSHEILTKEQHRDKYGAIPN